MDRIDDEIATRALETIILELTREQAEFIQSYLSGWMSPIWNEIMGKIAEKLGR